MEAEVRAWKPPIAGIREVLHARFVTHAYPRHTHETWTLFVVDDGVVHYDLDRHARCAAPSDVSILPPYVVHDGRPGTDAGYRKRVIYLEAAVLGDDRIGPAVDAPSITERHLRRRLDQLFTSLECIDDALEAETRFAFLVERLRHLLDRHPRTPSAPASAIPDPSGIELAEALRAILDERLFESVTMARAAAEIGASPTRLSRAFAATFGIPPHAYVDARRLEAARARILRGQPLADVALDVGYHDQAHLNRRFKRFLGTTPGRFGEGIRIRPS